MLKCACRSSAQLKLLWTRLTFVRSYTISESKKVKTVSLEIYGSSESVQVGIKKIKCSSNVRALRQNYVDIVCCKNNKYCIYTEY